MAVKTKRPAAKKATKKASAKAVKQATKKATAKKAVKKTAATRKTPEKAPAKPRLLSGGNPQIPKGEGDAPVRAYLAAIPGWKREVAERLDALVERTVPGVRKAVKWNSPFYGAPGAEGWFLSFHCFDRYLKVTFFRGQSLRPVPPEASKVQDTRYVHLREGEAFDEKRLADWLEQASRLPGEKM